MGYTASIPCMYAAVSRYLGWVVHKDEGKVTGLAGHGKYDDKIYKALEHLCQYDSHSMTFTPAGVATSDFGISTFKIPSSFENRTLRDIGLKEARDKYAVSIICITRREDILISPNLEEELYPGDIITVWGNDDDIARFSN